MECWVTGSDSTKLFCDLLFAETVPPSTGTSFPIGGVLAVKAVCLTHVILLAVAIPILGAHLPLTICRSISCRIARTGPYSLSQLCRPLLDSLQPVLVLSHWSLFFYTTKNIFSLFI